MFVLFGMIIEKGFNMISKELWIEVINPDFKSDVFEDGIIETFELENNTLKVCIFSESNNINCKGTGLYTPYNINIYELSHKCKEWAYKRGFLYWYENSRLFIKIMYSCKVDFVLDIGEYKKPFEIDIDFKACQWILDNKED